MSGRKNKNRKQRGQSAELLNELHSIRDLLGSDEIGDIPLLDQVAEPAPKPPQAAPVPARQPLQEPLDVSELPILFSPVDEELPEDYRAELGEAERELLRPLQDLPKKAEADKPQGELFAAPAAAPGENPFLPAHIRARLTGGRMPKAEPEPEAQPEQQEPQTAPAPEEDVPPPSPAAPAEPAANASREERDRQRQQLIDHLVAKQLPELERQLRERIARMVDELETKR
ncbi:MULTISPECIES: hypothetical protein [unclassified Microbulbifer]|uniref:hypothetical protein n=1 Tax=unclassified Microbulbifer TaxID=2619833 RepID=UPI0027E51389|nr:MULTISPECIES: hypothetical protein [unclassified Microbulbifer]